jgi:hypothetical protein
MFGRPEQDSPSTALYREYVGVASRNPAALPSVLQAYAGSFHDLPVVRSSALAPRWVADEAAQPKRVVIVHPNDAPFKVLATTAARIAAVLYQSNIRWSSITNGCEADLAGGVTVRLVAERDVAAYEADALVVWIDDVPEEESGIAEKLFGAKSAMQESATASAQGWRARLQAPSTSGAVTSSAISPPAEAVAPKAAPVKELNAVSEPEIAILAPRPREWLWIGLVAGLLCAMMVLVLVLLLRDPGAQPNAANGTPTPTGATSVPAPATAPSLVPSATPSATPTGDASSAIPPATASAPTTEVPPQGAPTATASQPNPGPGITPRPTGSTTVKPPVPKPTSDPLDRLFGPSVPSSTPQPSGASSGKPPSTKPTSDPLDRLFGP